MPRPTLEEFVLHGCKIGLPETEAERAYYYYEANGWKVGRAAMKSWQSALQYWKRTFQARMGKVAAVEPAWAKEKRLRAELDQLRAKLFRLGDVSPLHSHDEAAKIRSLRQPVIDQICETKKQLGMI